jgi:hypothetical protein
MKVDTHQHLWTDPLVKALTTRSELPFIRAEGGVPILHLTTELPYIIKMTSETSKTRAMLLKKDGLERALVCISSPLGMESLPRDEALKLIDAYHEGALSLGNPFGVWGAIALDNADPDDVDRALALGCVGISLPSGALDSVDAITALHPILARIESLNATLFVHPGPGLDFTKVISSEVPPSSPVWWPALTSYIAGMHSAWMAFLVEGRPKYPRLRVIFSMLAGLAPLHMERLLSRGVPAINIEDHLIFYETSSYSDKAVNALLNVVGKEQLLYGSDRPVIDPTPAEALHKVDWKVVSKNTSRALGE